MQARHDCEVKQFLVAFAVALVGSAAAQSKPNFAGAWVSVPDPAITRPETQLVIRQTADEFIIESQGSAGPQKLMYKLDGSETTNMIPGRGGGGANATATSTAAWEGNKLAIRTTIPRGVPPNVRTIRFRQVFSLEPDGRLVVEQSATLDDGAPPETNRIVYRKVGRTGF